MSIFTGTLPYGTGTVTAYRTPVGAFTDRRQVAQAPVSDAGIFRIVVPRAGAYHLVFRTLRAQYPALDVTATDGKTEVALTSFTTPILRAAAGQDRSPSGGGGGSAPSTGGGSVDRLSNELGSVQTQKLSRGWPDRTGTGVTHRFEGDEVVYEAGPGGTMWRTESIWGIDNAGHVDAIKFARGNRLTAEFDMWLSPEFGSQPSDHHNILFQLHGPLRFGNGNERWDPPPVELNIQNGSYRISSSSTSPGPAGESLQTFSEAHPRLWLPSAVRYAAWHKWKVSVLLDGPGIGRVDVWLDGQPLYTDWRPRAGTFYTQSPNTTSVDNQYDHGWVYFKTGIYGRGSSSPLVKTMRMRNLRLTRHELNGVQTWYL